MSIRINSTSNTYMRIAIEHLNTAEKYHEVYLKYKQEQEKYDAETENYLINNAKSIECQIEFEKASAVTIVFVCMALESFIYDYSARNFKDRFTKKYLEKIDTLGKYVIIPKLVTGKELDRASETFSLLNKVIKTRNKIIHSKSKAIDSIEDSIEKIIKTEIDYLQEAKDAIRMIDLLITEFDKIDINANSKLYFTPGKIIDIDEEYLFNSTEPKISHSIIKVNRKKFKLKSFASIVVPIFVAIASLVVTLAGIFISSTQNKILRLKTQPHFNVSSLHGEKMINGNFVDKEIYIYNSGGNFYDFSCNNITFLRIEFNNKKYLLPLDSFYFGSQEFFGNPNGIIYKCFGDNSNHELMRISNDFKEHQSKNNSFGLINEVTYSKIIYQDISGKYHTLYFDTKSGKMLENNLGNRIFELHRGLIKNIRNFNNYPRIGLSIDTIEINVIEEYINCDFKIIEEELITL